MVGCFALNGVRSLVRFQQRCLSNLNSAPLVELGRLLKPNAPTAAYKPGNFFIHRQLGYRGVVVDKWTPTVYSYPDLSSHDVAASSLTDKHQFRDIATADIHSAVYYQVFCDARDTEHMNDQSVQSWTHANSLVGDVDYVSHNDILPFAPSESVGFRNGLYSIYFRRRSALAHQLAASMKFNEKSILTGSYCAWEQLTKRSLSHSKIYRAKTDDIQVTVIPFFECRDEGQHDPANPFDPKPFVWFYQVLIENQGPVPVQLVSRLWHMFDGQGNQDKICGPGVVGVMPILSDASPSFQYVSSITMGTSSGVMGGSLTFVELLPSGVHGRTIDVSIPTFHLNSPAVDEVLDHDAEDFSAHVRRSRKYDDRYLD